MMLKNTSHSFLSWYVNTGRLVYLLRFNEFFWTKSKWNSNVFRGAIGVARSDVVSRVSEILPSTCATLAAGAAPPSFSVRPEWIFFCFFSKKSLHSMLLHTIDDFFFFFIKKSYLADFYFFVELLRNLWEWIFLLF